MVNLYQGRTSGIHSETPHGCHFYLLTFIFYPSYGESIPVIHFAEESQKKGVLSVPKLIDHETVNNLILSKRTGNVWMRIQGGR